MRIRILVVLLCIAHYVSATERIIDTKISQVTLFPSGAQVIRQTNFQLEPGKTRLLIKGLSPYTDLSGLQVSGEGSFSILSVNPQYDYISQDEIDKHNTELQKLIELQKLKLEDEQNRLSISTEKLSFLRDNHIIGGKEQALSPESFRLYTEQYHSAIEKLSTEQLSLKRNIKKIEEELNRLKQQANDPEYTNTGARSAMVFIEVSSKSATLAKIRLSYLVSQAGWEPAYDLRIEKIGEPVELVMRAIAWQQTNEDWNDIKLGFSSAQPNQSGNAPELNPFYLQIINSNNIRIRGVSSMAPAVLEDNAMNEVVVVGYGTQKKGKMFKTEALDVMVDEQKTALEYHIDIPYTLRSDNNRQTIEIAHYEMPAVYEHRAIPKLEKAAFLIARIPNWTTYPILNGEATLYFDNTLVGKTSIDTQSTEDTLNLSLGRDSKVLITREKQKEYSQRRILSSTQTDSRQWKLTVKNNRKEAIKMVISDQIPLTSSSTIEVKANTPKDSQYNEKTGEVKWEIQLEPSDKKEVQFSYEVKYPKDQKINLTDK